MSLFDVIAIAIYIVCGVLLGKFLGTKYGSACALVGFIAGFLAAFGFLRIIGSLFRKPKAKRNAAVRSTDSTDK